MNKININKAKTYLPLSTTKGTTKQRLQKARLFNVRFYENLQDSFVKREIKPSTFKKNLQETCGTKINIKMFQAQNEKAASLTHLLHQNGTAYGYALDIPYTYNGSIHQRMTPIFLKETQKFFNEVFNPKFFARRAAIYNKKLLNMSGVEEFYRKNIAGTAGLDKKMLDDFLCDKPPYTQVNLLQMFRYDLLAEQNVHAAQSQIDRSIERTENLKYINKNYDLSAYKYDDKLALLNEKLKAALQKTREKIQNR